MTDARNTLLQYLLDSRNGGNLDDGVATLLQTVATACKAIAYSLKDGELAGILGSLDTENVQGETQKKLDVLANDIFLRQCENSGVLAAMVSEEMDDIYQIPDRFPRGKYVLLFDPLDGSSNIDINVSVGSIFSIIRLDDVPDRLTHEDVLRPGTHQIAAGFAFYGPSTMFILTTGNGVDAFTLDAAAGEFRQTRSGLTIPEETAEIAINASRRRHWDEALRTYVDQCFSGSDGPRNREFNMRWVASMVAEVHRILIRGGIFIYPVDASNRATGGKLRLLYEANPMAFLIEQAGGAAIDGSSRLLDLQPHSLHQRIGVMLGSRREIFFLAEQLI